MKIMAIIQARMSSQRFPGKVLYAVKGRPLLSFMVERVRRCNVLDGLIIATSRESDDDRVEEYCVHENISCCRGPLEDVAQRFKEAVVQYEMDGFVRLSGDSPFIDQDIIARAVTMFRSGRYDIVTNVFPRSYPRGQSVEVVATKTFLRDFARIDRGDCREHITKYFYQHHDAYAIANFESGVKDAVIQLCVDTPEDGVMFEKIIERLREPYWQYGWEEIVKVRQSVCAAQ